MSRRYIARGFIIKSMTPQGFTRIPFKDLKVGTIVRYPQVRVLKSQLTEHEETLVTRYRYLHLLERHVPIYRRNFGESHPFNYSYFKTFNISRGCADIIPCGDWVWYHCDITEAGEVLTPLDYYERLNDSF